MGDVPEREMFLVDSLEKQKMNSRKNKKMAAK